MPADWSRATCDRPRTRAFDACRASRQLIAGARGRIDARLALGVTALVEVGTIGCRHLKRNACSMTEGFRFFDVCL